MTIPTYKGKTSDKPVTDWLKTAERVAQNNNWDPAQKIRFFSEAEKPSIGTRLMS